MRYVYRQGESNGLPILWRTRDEKALGIEYTASVQSDPYEIWQPVDSPVPYVCSTCGKTMQKGGLRFVAIGGQGMDRGDMSMHVSYLQKMRTRLLERVKCPECRWAKPQDKTSEEKAAGENRPKRKTSLD